MLGKSTLKEIFSKAELQNNKRFGLDAIYHLCQKSQRNNTR